MSRTHTTKAQPVIVIHCDFGCLPKPWGHPKACSNKCGKDVCYSCGFEDPRDHGDYPDRYCPECWALEEREVYYNYQDEADERLDILQDRWREAAGREKA